MVGDLVDIEAHRARDVAGEILGCGVALPLTSSCVALGGASALAQDARTTMQARAIANVLVIGRLPWWRG